MTSLVLTFPCFRGQFFGVCTSEKGRPGPVRYEAVAAADVLARSATLALSQSWGLRAPCETGWAYPRNR